MHFISAEKSVYRVEAPSRSSEGSAVCTAAIQSAIDAAGAAGGGRVDFAPGVYYTGAIFLKSNVELYLARDVELRGVKDDLAYPEIFSRVAGIEMRWPSALINVYEQENVAITGQGTINGQGEYWWNKYWGADERSGMLADYEARGLRWAVDYDCRRPRLILVYKSVRVTLSGLHLKRSGFWTVHLCFSSQISVDGLVIRDNGGPSSDGIDIDSSRDVVVRYCDIDCNDDGICLKSGRDADGLRVNRPTERITIHDCLVRSGHGLITIGSETSGGIRDINVHRVKALGTWIGISFKSAATRGGVVERVSLRDITMTGVPRPFRFVLNWMPNYSYPSLPPGWTEPIPEHWRILLEPVPRARGLPEFRSLRFKDINVTSGMPVGLERVESSSIRMHTPNPRDAIAFDVEAFPEKPFRDFLWEDIAIETETAGRIAHARNWQMENVKIFAKDRSTIQLVDCEGVQLPTNK